MPDCADLVERTRSNCWIVDKMKHILIHKVIEKSQESTMVKRKKVLPRVFEAIIYLKENAKYWGPKLVQDMLAGSYDNELSMEDF